MDWATFYKHYETWIVGIVFLLLGIPASIIASRIDDYLKYRSLTAKDRKINSILNHYSYVVYLLIRGIRNFRARQINPNYKPKDKLNAYDIIIICSGGAFIVGALSLNTFVDVFGKDAAEWYIEIVMALTFPFYVFIMMAQVNYIRAIRDIRRFGKYLEETKAKLKKLGCNPEVLAKITKEVKKEFTKQ